jgi:hypothetical protein
VTLTLVSDDPLALVAWAFDDDTTAIGVEAEHTFMSPATHRADVWAVTENGATARLTVPVPIGIQHSSGCATVGPRRASWAQVLCCLGFLIRLARPRVLGRRADP